MAQYENVAMVQKGVAESILSLQPNDDGTFTITAKQSYPRKKDKVIEMTFTENGINALIGVWLSAVEFNKNSRSE